MREGDGDNADGFYATEEKKIPKEGGSVLHKDVADVKNSITELTKKIDNFQVPETVGIEVEIEIEYGKRIRASVNRMLNPNENMDDAHETLYKQCLGSLAKLIG